MDSIIELEDVYVEDIVKGMAREMGGTIVENNNTTFFKIPIQSGEGSIRATQFASGLGCISVKYTLKKETIFEIEKDKINPLKLVFNLGETFLHKFEEEKEFKELEKYSLAIIATNAENSHYFKVPKEKNINIFSVELNRHLFEHKINDFKFELDSALIELLKDTNCKKPFFFSCLFGAKEYDFIQEINSLEKTSFITSLFKEGLVYNLLSLSFENYLGKNFTNEYVKMNKADLSIILKASSFIENNLNNLPIIEHIAAKYFISESKIQKLFKEYYKCSVHDFISNKRLEKAKDFLENSNLSITEIAEDLGIRSKSYFSKIFKDRYGVTPSTYRNSRLSEIRFY